MLSPCSAMMQQYEYLPWVDRFPQLFFFGSTTGPRNLLRDDERLHRNVNMDIQISGWSENRRPDQFISIPQHCNYRLAGVELGRSGKMCNMMLWRFPSAVTMRPGRGSMKSAEASEAMEPGRLNRAPTLSLSCRLFALQVAHQLQST